jgi:fibronectin-binding autotransporter adhesin
MKTAFFAERNYAATDKVTGHILSIALLAMFLCPLSMFAQCTSTWSEGAMGSWDTSTNWTPTGVPNSSSNTCISTSGSAVTINAADATDNLTLGSTDSLSIAGGESLSITAGGNINNAGNIVLGSSASPSAAFLNILGATTLSAGGTVTLNNFIIEGGGTLTNQETIQGGGGTIGGASLTLVNSGVIDANQSLTLFIDPSGGTTNTKTIEETGGGTLQIAGTTKNTGGTILATGTNSGILLQATDIISGTLTSASGGVIVALGDLGPVRTILSGVTISSGTILDVPAGEGGQQNLLFLSGTITNNGTINVEGSNSSLTTGDTTLAGKGKVILLDNASIYGSNQTLTNQGTIEGEGSIGVASSTVGLINSGSISANEKAGGAIFIMASGAGFTNNVGTKNGILNVSAKNTITIEGSLNNFNTTTGTLTGGEYLVTGTLAFDAGTTGIVTNDAVITLTGASPVITNSETSTSALSGFTTNGTKGDFTVDSGAFTDANAFTNSGIIAVGSGGKFDSTGTLSNFNSSTSILTGGSYALTATGQFQFNNGSDSSDIVTNDAKITLAGVDTTKSSFIDQTGANALANFAANGSSGSLLLTTNRNYSTPGNFTNAGIVDVEKSTGTGHTQLTIGATGTGNYTQTGGTTTVDGLLTTTGAINIQGGFLYGDAGTITGTLNLTGGTFSPGDGVEKLGDITVDGSYNQSGTGDLTIDLDGTTPDTKYDVLNIDGAAALGGTLTVDLVGTYKLAVGNTFDIVNWSSDSGSFANIVLPALAGGDTWNVSITSSGIVLTVEAPAAPAAPATGAVTSASTHEPVAILTRAVTCGFAARLIASCRTELVSTVAIGGQMHAAVSERPASAVHNNVMAATRSISAGPAEASHTPSVSATSMARFYICAYLPSSVGHTMGCN